MNVRLLRKTVFKEQNSIRFPAPWKSDTVRKYVSEYGFPDLKL